MLAVVHHFLSLHGTIQSLSRSLSLSLSQYINIYISTHNCGTKIHKNSFDNGLDEVSIFFVFLSKQSTTNKNATHHTFLSRAGQVKLNGRHELGKATSTTRPVKYIDHVGTWINKMFIGFRRECCIHYKGQRSQLITSCCIENDMRSIKRPCRWLREIGESS
jgi:hypothetical protein